MPQNNRPYGITTLMVLGVFGGAFIALTGLLIILDRNDTNLQGEAFNTAGQLAGFGASLILAGLVQLVLALMLGGGSNVVRILFAIGAVFSVAGGLWALVALHGEQQAAGAGSLAYGLIVLFLLFNHRADEYFESANH
jgi:hypothetical protein